MSTTTAEKVERTTTVFRAVVILLITIIMAVSVSSMALTNGQQAGQITTLSENNDALREQVKDSGDVPVAPPASEVVDDPTPSAGVAGERGLRGADGTDGYDGKDGLNGTNGVDSTATGAPGADGIGTNGTDGAAGQDGADGAVGAAGAPGGNGEPPYGWTQPGDVPGTTETCTRAEPFDPAAPTYTCT